MKGKKVFNANEIDLLKSLIRQRNNADKAKQKSIRDQMRNLGFYGRDDWGINDCHVSDLENLIASGQIKVIGAAPSQAGKANIEKKVETPKLETDELSSFSSPVRISKLRNQISMIPEAPGIYIVLRKKKNEPVFLTVGSGGHHKGKNPNVPVPELESNWIPGEEIVYIGMTRSSLRHRINTYLRFGQGQPVGHWGGRFIWQLEDHEDLEFCWKAMPTGDPDQVESQLIDLFKQQHGGKRPFANLAK